MPAPRRARRRSTSGRSSAREERPCIPRTAATRRSTSGSQPRATARRVGITDYAQKQLGDVVFVELPEVGPHAEGARGLRHRRVGEGGLRAVRARRRRGGRGERRPREHARDRSTRTPRRGLDDRAQARGRRARWRACWTPPPTRRSSRARPSRSEGPIVDAVSQAAGRRALPATGRVRAAAHRARRRRTSRGRCCAALGLPLARRAGRRDRARRASGCAGPLALPARARRARGCSPTCARSPARNQRLPLVPRHGLPRHASRPPSSSATSSRTPAGTRSTRRTRPRSRRAGWRRCSTSRRWWPTSPACRSPTRRCSTRPRPPPRRCTCATRSARRRRDACSSSPRTATRRRSRSCGRAPSRSASRCASGRRDAVDLAGRPVRRARAVPDDRRARARLRARSREARARRGRAGRGGDRPARADAAAPPGEFGADIAVGSSAALRRAAGLRRPARGLPVHARRAQAPDAGPARRRVEGRAGQARLPPGAADARAAHPPREGHEQHLHRAGAAGGDGRDVRGLPRARGPARASRGACTRSTARAARGPAPARASTPAATPFFDTLRVRVDRRRPRDRCERARAARHQPARVRRRLASASPSTRPTPPATCSALLRGVRRAEPLAFARRRARGRGRRRASRRRSRARARFLTHPVFNTHHSEHEMLRYMRRLEARDLSLTTSMIPLGSCTMKLNATAEMMPGDLAGVRAAAPVRARRAGRGLREAVRAARGAGWPRSPASPRCRCSRTRARRASTRACWRSAPTTRAAARQHRDVCLIPVSAHGTNPASARDGRLPGRGGRLRRAGQHRRRRPARRRPAQHAQDLARADGHLPVHPRRVRGDDPARSARSSTSTAARSTWTART